MPISSEFREVLRQVAGGVRQSEIVRRTGISSAYVNGLVSKGVVPSREKLAQLADGLDISGHQRARLFAAAGYSPDAQTGKGQELPPHVRELAEMARPLKPHQVEAVKQMLASFIESELSGAVYA